MKKMFRYFKTEQGQTRALIALFKYQRHKTQGVSLYVIDNAKTVEKKRTGRLIYSKRRNHPAPSAHPSRGGELEPPRRLVPDAALPPASL